MKPRFTSDYKTLLWAFVLFPGTMLIPYASPCLLVWSLPLTLYVGFCAGIFAHNHNPTFRSPVANGLFAAWVSVFYGYPIFAWIPTHNRNHHKHRNRQGDATITWRYSKANTWLIASTYLFVSAYWQNSLIRAFVGRARESSPRLRRRITVERLCFRTAHAMLLAMAILLHGWRLGAIVYAAKAGRVHTFDLRPAANTTTVAVNVAQLPAGGSLTATWYDLDTGTTAPASPVAANAVATFTKPFAGLGVLLVK